ncbi:hypothetical protein U9M48_009491 [Paspalum notatum var. saurae]|uniref:Uncharacterized protein n=1 Tax=Paspalum notatum var. saurae TaxID=547442 RepID=A0AAQ3WF54_PASNO
MGSGDPAADPLSSFLRHPGALSFSRRVAMARDATPPPPCPRSAPGSSTSSRSSSSSSSPPTSSPSCGYWIYRLATDGSRQPARSKKH